MLYFIILFSSYAELESSFTKCSSLVAPEVLEIMLTTYNAASDDNFVNDDFPFSMYTCVLVCVLPNNGTRFNIQ